MLSTPLTPMQAMFAAGPSRIGVTPRPVSGPLTPMQVQFAGGPTNAGVRPPQSTSRGLVPQAPYRPNWNFAPYQGSLTVPPTAVVQTPQGGWQGAAMRAPTPQLGYMAQSLPAPAQVPRLPAPALPPSMMARAGAALGSLGRAAFGPVGTAAQGLVSAGMAGWERGAPTMGQDAYTYDQMGGITGLAPDAPPAQTPSPQSPTSLYDEFGHATADHPAVKQMMERPKVIAKQRQAAMQRMMPSADTRGAGMTLKSNVNGIREYEAPIDMSSIGVSAPSEYPEDFYQ